MRSSRRSAKARGRSTRCSRRADETGGGRMRRLLIGVAVIGLAQPSVAQPGPAQVATAQAIERVQRIDPQLGAVLALDPTAMAQARRANASGFNGPLAGQPFLIKDNIEAAGPLPTTAGSLALANNVTNRDSPLVARLRSAGGVILGKTNL